MLRILWRSVQILLMLLGVLAAAVVALRVQDSALRSAAEPPWSVRTLEDFRKWQPARAEGQRIEARGSIYYLVRGERARTLASGPSGYVFDERGNFVGWIQDLGDDSWLRIVLENDAGKSRIPLPEIATRVAQPVPARQPR
jgi:hypothetical protein